MDVKATASNVGNSDKAQTLGRGGIVTSSRSHQTVEVQNENSGILVEAGGNPGSSAGYLNQSQGAQYIQGPNHDDDQFQCIVKAAAWITLIIDIIWCGISFFIKGYFDILTLVYDFEGKPFGLTSAGSKLTVFVIVGTIATFISCCILLCKISNMGVTRSFRPLTAWISSSVILILFLPIVLILVIVTLKDQDPHKVGMKKLAESIEIPNEEIFLKTARSVAKDVMFIGWVFLVIHISAASVAIKYLMNLRAVAPLPQRGFEAY